MTTWQISTTTGDPTRVATILPGSGYTAQGPLLWYAAKALRAAGWSVRTFAWDELSPDWGEARQVYGESLRDAPVPDGGRHLVVAKSLGSFALPVAAELGLPGVWLTPVLTGDASEPVRAALAAGTAPGLLAGGTADPLWDGGVVTAPDTEVLEVDGADHSLEVGDWRVSHEILARVTGAVERFAAQL
ncbi:hypothetical protein [Promicromonospora sp. NPDC019610]|uniref:hypothetical protein n=1 Tax=Promicromonospora sp. NPDC019610 TaxID=3364405 RepID=UPI0037AFDCD6